MAHRISPSAEADLDEIWLYVAKESGSIEIDNRRPREDFGADYRSLAVGQYLIVYCIEDEDALILRVLHGRRDIETLLGR